MTHRIPSLALAGVLGLGGATAGLVVVPAVASAAPEQASAAGAAGDRVTRITQALSGLVSDGSLSQEQADEVATTLAETLPHRGGHGGPGGHGGRGVSLETAAETLDLSVEDLRTQLEGGSSLADVAEAQGVERQALIDALVEAAQTRLDEAVTAGDLTQEQADARKADLAEHIAEHVDRAGLRGHGPRGDRPSDEQAQAPAEDGATS